MDPTRLRLPGLLFLACLARVAPAQEELWRVWPVLDGIGYPATLGDFDGDGYQDIVLAVTLDIYTANERIAMRVLSGRNGATLYERNHGYRLIHDPVALGDVDGDGYPDFAFAIESGNAAFPNRLEVWSPHLDQMLWVATGSFSGGFGLYSIGLNLDNDPRREVITCTQTRTDSTVFAYDDNGTLLYTINILQTNQWIRGLGVVGDIDQDGADDFGVGLVEGTGRGGVMLFSGRTGAWIRTDWGTQIGDALGKQIVPMGDMDRDGVPDYAASNNIGYRGVITVFSGATGQVIREWSDPQSVPAERLLGGMDLDLDGVPDVFTGAPHYYNGEPIPQIPWGGRVQALSGRDGGLLWLERGEYPTDSVLGAGICCLGPQPGNPYPVLVVHDWTAPGPAQVRSWRIRAIRANLAGTAISGTGCTNLSVPPPQIAVRQDVGSLRVTLSGAPPGAMAWLLAGEAAATSWAGRPLPIPLDGLGMPGCTLQAPGDLILFRGTGTTGWDAGLATVSAPLSVATSGFPVAVQWLVLAPSASLGHALTPRHELRVQ